MFCKRVTTITKRARKRLEQIHAEHREKSEWLLGVFGELSTGTQDVLTPPEGHRAQPEPSKATAERVGRAGLLHR